MGLILPRWGLILPRIPPSTPVLYSAAANPFRVCVGTQKTQNPAPKHPFSWPELESGQDELQSGQNGPKLGKMFEKWAKLFYKWAKKIYSFYFFTYFKDSFLCLMLQYLLPHISLLAYMSYIFLN